MNPYTVTPYLREFAFEPTQPPEDLTWQDAALCAQADPDEWYPEKGGSVLHAKAICRRCPVREPCLGSAMDRSEPHGVWGGLSHEEREHFAAAYKGGISLEDIMAAADARAGSRRAAAAEHSREATLASAAQRAAPRPGPSPDPQSREQEAA